MVDDTPSNDGRYLMRQNGMNPPPQFEEEVLARYQFEDKWAAEDKKIFHNAKAEGKKILKPEVPADFNIKATFGNNMVLMAEVPARLQYQEQTFGNNMVLMSEDDEGPTIEEDSLEIYQKF